MSEHKCMVCKRFQNTGEYKTSGQCYNHAVRILDIHNSSDWGFRTRELTGLGSMINPTGNQGIKAQYLIPQTVCEDNSIVYWRFTFETLQLVNTLLLLHCLLVWHCYTLILMLHCYKYLYASCLHCLHFFEVHVVPFLK